MMSSGVAIGVDIGSSGVKAVAVRADGSSDVVAHATIPVDLLSPMPGAAEADPEQWWSATVSAVGRVLAQSPTGTPIAAISFAGMVPAVVLAGHDGRPLGRAFLQNDARATREIRELTAELADVGMLERTGSVISQQSLAPTVRWLQRHDAERWHDARWLMGSYDYVSMRAGADPAVEFNWALEGGLCDLDANPLEAVYQSVELSPDRVPPIVRSGTVIGAVSNVELGVPLGTPIVVGGADHVMSAAAAGVAGPGDCLIKLGGAGDILAATDQQVVDRRLYLDAHPHPGRWMPNGCMATSGSMIRWLAEIHGRSDLEALDAEAATATPGALLALPYFLGEKSPHHDARLRGAFVGLHLGTTVADMHRATLEAVAFGFRQHVEILTDVGVKPTRFMVTNGGSKSTLWKQILADVLDAELIPVIDHPGASFGAAYQALGGDWDDVEAALPHGDPVVPERSRVGLYDERYRQFLSLQTALEPFSHQLAEVPQP